jgi:hypothetical protein
MLVVAVLPPADAAVVYMLGLNAGFVLAAALAVEDGTCKTAPPVAFGRGRAEI